MKRKCAGKVRWEIGFAQLVPVAERKDPNYEIEKLEPPVVTKEDISIMKVESPTRKMLKEYQRQQKDRDQQKREQLAENYPHRIDKGILWPIWCDDEKLFAKYSRDKFKLTRHTVSPFVNWHSMNNDLLIQMQKFRDKMKKLDKESDYFNMIFKEIDEDDSEEETFEEKAFK